MATDHRGMPVGTNHRPLPQAVQKAIALQISRTTNIGNSDAMGLAANVIKAHRSGQPVSLGSSIETGPAMTGLNSYIGDKEYNEVMDRIGPGLYDHGRDDAFSDKVAYTNYPHEVNRAVRNAGGTGGFIGEAIKNRKGWNVEDDF